MPKIARFFETGVYGIQKHLYKLELGGVLVSRHVGRARPYTFNQRCPFLRELESLLEKALSFYPEEIRDGLLMLPSPRESSKKIKDEMSGHDSFQA